MADTTRRSDWPREGAIGGLLAGIVMAMVAMLYTLVAQGDLLAPVKQMGALLFATNSGSLVSIGAGLMIHMVMSIAFGVLFALAVRGRAAGYAPLLVAGLVFIAVEWAVASYVVLPAIDRPLLQTFAASGGVAAHLMYGAVLGLWLAWRVAPFALVRRPLAH